MFYVYMSVMDIMDVLRTGMNMYISRIHVWLCYIERESYLVCLIPEYSAQYQW